MQNRIESPVLFEPRPSRKSEAFVAAPTTLRGLGIENQVDQRLNLAGERVLIARLPYLDGSAYIAIVQHPFSGDHFAQLLNAIAPNPQGHAGDIVGDLRLPDDFRDYEKRYGLPQDGEPMLHQRHENDPVIGELYKEFDTLNRPAWRKALEYSAFSRPFTCFDSLEAFDSTNPYPLYEKIKEGAVSSLLVGNNLSFLGHERLGDLARGVLESMTVQEQMDYAVKFCLLRGNVLVDLQKGIVQKNWKGGSIEFEVLDSEKIVIHGYQGLDILAHLRDVQTNQWIIDSYTLPPKYYEQGLFPLIAWTKDQKGSRRFLNQRDVEPILRYSLGLGKDQRTQLDAKLGEVFTAFFSVDAVESWKQDLYSKDFLQDEPDRHQKIMGGQVPLWVAHPANVPPLTSDQNPVLPVLERVFS